MSNQIVIRDTLKSEKALAEFTSVLRNASEANAYIRSVLIAVANSTALQECEPTSILTSAMRAATLRLSVDPGTGEAYLVPFKGKCTLIIGYKGYKNMALRTGQYRYLNVSHIYEGEEIAEDRLTGMHSFSGGKTSNTVIGWLLYFELMSGFRKSVYMTVEEIHESAKKYSKSYDRADSPWKTERAKMEMKTVLRQGLGRWGYFDPHDNQVIAQVERAEEAPEIIDGETFEPGEPAEPQPEPEKMTEAQIMLELGF